VQGQHFSFLSYSLSPAVRQTPWVPAILFPGLKWLECEVNHSEFQGWQWVELLYSFFPCKLLSLTLPSVWKICLWSDCQSRIYFTGRWYKVLSTCCLSRRAWAQIVPWRRALFITFRYYPQSVQKNADWVRQMTLRRFRCVPFSGFLKQTNKLESLVQN